MSIYESGLSRLPKSRTSSKNNTELSPPNFLVRHSDKIFSTKYTRGDVRIKLWIRSWMRWRAPTSPKWIRKYGNASAVWFFLSPPQGIKNSSQDSNHHQGYEHTPDSPRGALHKIPIFITSLKSVQTPKKQKFNPTSGIIVVVFNHSISIPYLFDIRV